MSQSDSQTEDEEEEWSSDHPQVVNSTCGETCVAYTGVTDVEVRDCAKCMDPVRIDPDGKTVEHID